MAVGEHPDKDAGRRALMNRRETREMLAIQADELIGLRARRKDKLTRNDQVQSLLDLAEQLQGILVPVEPKPDYRRRLHGELLLEAQGREVEPGPNRFQQHRKGILIGAAAVGSVASVVGVIVAFVWRLRHGRAAHTATG
jgi:hypothetical protein